MWTQAKLQTFQAIWCAMLCRHSSSTKAKELDVKAVAAILVGYDMISMPCRCYVPATNRVTISRGVRFFAKKCNWKATNQRGKIYDDLSVTTAVVEADNCQAQVKPDHAVQEAPAAETLTHDDEENTIATPNINSPSQEQQVRRLSRTNKGIPPKLLITAINAAIAGHESQTYNQAISSLLKGEWNIALV